MADQQGSERSEDRALRYVRSLTKVMEDLESKGYLEDPKLRPVIENVKAYLSDAKYYIDKGDYETALVSVAYAEGLLDALVYLGLVPKYETEHVKEPVVFVAGTFDLIHPGHIELLRYAASLGRLYVVLSRDANVVKDKGREPVLDERSRLAVISAIRYVYRAMLGDESDYLRPIEEIMPDIVVLGPDQPVNEDELAESIFKRTGKRPLVIRFKEKVSFGEGLKGSRDLMSRACAIISGTKPNGSHA